MNAGAAQPCARADFSFETAHSGGAGKPAQMASKWLPCSRSPGHVQPAECSSAYETGHLALRLAIAKGFDDPMTLKTDPDLAPIQHDPRLKSQLTRFGKR
jgi:hypothetical protein